MTEIHLILCIRRFYTETKNGKMTGLHANIILSMDIRYSSSKRTSHHQKVSHSTEKGMPTIRLPEIWNGKKMTLFMTSKIIVIRIYGNGNDFYHQKQTNIFMFFTRAHVLVTSASIQSSPRNHMQWYLVIYAV